MPDHDILPIRQTSHADEAFAVTLSDVLEQGHLCQQEISSSVGSGKESKELLNYALVLNSPRERLVYNTKRRLNLPGAIARFVWMMAASDRLADIAFYEEKVRFFSDNGIAVPGSNYGMRMLSPRPGLNQLESVIERLKEDPSSRRAAISIFQAEDAVRESKDIPCTFGLFYHIRQGVLRSTTFMRSNNAFLLLPYNLFEFSLLAEIVAAELGVPLGPLTHHAVSMHIYDGDYAKAREVIEAWSPNKSVEVPKVPAMPSNPTPLGQVTELVILEATLRHGSAGLNAGNVEEWIARGTDKLHPYWAQMYYLLLLHVAKKNRDRGALAALESVISDPWHSFLPADAFSAVTQSRTDVPAWEMPDSSAQGGTIIPFFSTRSMQSLKVRVSEWEREASRKMSWNRYAKLQETFLKRLAARGPKGSESDISREEFLQILNMTTDAENAGED